MDAFDPRRVFGAEALAAVREATAAAEGRTAGEIVPYIVGRCDDYAEAGWTGATLGALLATGLAALPYYLGGYWGVPDLLWLALPPLAGAVAGYLLVTSVPRLKRWLVPAETFDRRTRLRAEAAFLEEEVFDTEGRTGVLIFLALFEHRAIVLADSGIHAAVPAGAWEGIVGALTAGMRAGRPADALLEAVRGCGELLAAYRVTVRPGDVDEIPDEPRLRDR